LVWVVRIPLDDRDGGRGAEIVSPISRVGHFCCFPF
jgi:hypothetical protein